ncbi:substrate-binding periplasmic protein [Bdellovibrio sp. BCCA]|uniref:substrate-binding periplasmic protein n=1 Tax=Bdellovibrio sp. BCCA TaxID=3136281 RepID=UPI0030F2A638
MILKSLFLISLILFSSVRVLAAEKLLFASSDSLPPKIYKEDGELRGTYVEIIREICKRMNVEAEFVTYPWARVMVMAKTGKVDAIFPPFKTPDREAFLYFTSEPMSHTRNVVFAPKKKHITVNSLNDLQGLTVGINDQYSYGPKFDAYKKNLNLDLSNNEEMLVNKLGRKGATKRIDVAIASEEVFKFLSKRLGFLDDFEVVYVLSANPSYVAFSKAKGEKAKELTEQYNKILLQLKKEGFVQKVMNKYIENEK